MRYLSVCSGIEAASVAWECLGWTPVAFSEIDRFPSQVLAQHYPNVPNWGDMTKFKEWPDADVDVLVGGTPCQSFSVAGLRKGLDDPRGNLMLTYLAIAARYRPEWLVWENVPGVLSSNGGEDFASLLRGLAELGYGWAYRVLDAQYFGVAQRRRRVFVVGHLGDWHPAAAVLFERASLSGNPAPSREAGKTIAPCVTNGPPFSRTGNERVEAEGMIAVRMVAFGEYVDDGTAGAMKARDYKDATDLVAQPIGFNTRQDPDSWQDRTGPVDTHSGTQGVAVAPSLTASNNPSRSPQSSEVTQQVGAVYQAAMQVRRLTPTECERLQGFPDGWTNIPWRGKPESPDGPRYKALGNSMAVPVMRWIGERIELIEDERRNPIRS